MSKSSNSNNDTNNQPPSTPRWVKVSGIIAISLILLVVAIKLFGGGNHGPGRHVPKGETTEQSMPVDQTPTKNQEQGINNIDDGGHKPPEGGD